MLMIVQYLGQLAEAPRDEARNTQCIRYQWLADVNPHRGHLELNRLRQTQTLHVCTKPCPRQSKTLSCV